MAGMKKELPHEHPLWGLSEDPGIPDKGILFTKDGDRTANTGAMEDFLQHAAVFVNGFGSEMRTCHSDSYGTIVDYAALDKALCVLDEHYKPTADDWRPLVRAWISNINMQPPLLIVALTAARRFGIEKAETEALLAKRKEDIDAYYPLRRRA